MLRPDPAQTRRRDGIGAFSEYLRLDALGWLLIVVALAGGIVNYGFRSYVFDDAYITYRYAQNLAQGNGLVFNPGERVLGTSSPLYALLLGVLGATGVPVDVLSGVVFCAALAGVALLGGALLRQLGFPGAALLFAAATVSGFGVVRLYFGIETPLYTLVLLLALAALSRGRDALAGGLAGVAFLLRHDAALFALALFAWLAWQRRRVPLRAACAAALVVAPWLLFAQLYYGSILPNTLAAKTGELELADYLLRAGGEQARRSFLHLEHYGPLQVPRLLTRLLVLGLFGALFAGTRRVVARAPWALLLLVFPVLLWLGYGLIGPPVEHAWYLLPGAYLLLLLALGAAAAAWLPQRFRRFGRVAAAVVAVALLLPLPASMRQELGYHQASGYYHSRTDTYRQMADWLRRTGLTDLRLMVHEPGYLAYLGQMPVVDAAGLVTKGVFFHGPAERRDRFEDLLERFAPAGVIPLGGIPPGWSLEGYVPTVTGFPARPLLLEQEVLTRRYAQIIASLDAAPAFDPTPGRPPLEPPFAFDFSRGEDGSRFVAAGGVPGHFDRLPVRGQEPERWPVVAATATEASPWDAIESPTLRLDCDELAFTWGADDDTNTAAQLVVDGVVVLQRNGRTANRLSLREQVWPVWPWRGKLGVLRIVDNAPAGRRAVLASLRSLEHRRDVGLDDFEAPGYADLWVETFGAAPAPVQPIAARHGLGLRLGRQAAASVGLYGIQTLRSAPFRIEHDWLGFVLYDFGGRQTSAALEVNGERYTEIPGGRSRRLRPVAWQVAALRGRVAVLVVEDRAPAESEWIGIDEIRLFDRAE